MKKILGSLCTMVLLLSSVAFGQQASATTIKATAVSNSVTLTWTAATPASGVTVPIDYIVYRSTTNGSGYQAIADVQTGVTYTDTAVAAGTTYYYVVRSNYESINSNQATAVVPPANPPPVAGNSATFVKVDTTTQGNWMGVYGASGESLEGIVTKTPSFASFSVVNDLTWNWASSTTDVRGLQTTSATARAATCWYNSSFSIDINVTDGSAHQIEIYVIDWDSQGRTEQITVTDGSTGAILNQQLVKSFTGGEYLVWTVTGKVNITAQMESGPNAVISALFWN